MKNTIIIVVLLAALVAVAVSQESFEYSLEDRAESNPKEECMSEKICKTSCRHNGFKGGHCSLPNHKKFICY